MGGIGDINNNNYNYNGVSWTGRREILKNNGIGNCFSRLFLASKWGSGKNAMSVAMSGTTAISNIKTGSLKEKKAIKYGQQFIQNLVNKFNSPNTTPKEKTEIANQIRSLTGKREDASIGVDNRTENRYDFITDNKLKDDLAKIEKDPSIRKTHEQSMTQQSMKELAAKLNKGNPHPK
ncbi:MAG: hypothetical protein LBB20_00355 [Puniceicoccales bacterium]|jgi:hypothetical protein|nr:hypothetical protein [Puniceicoccales bacterium]